MINDERAADGVEHLQSAALELIAAARAFLDVAEDLVHDRERVAEVVATAATLADVVAPDWAARRARPSGPARPAERPGPADEDASADEDGPAPAATLTSTTTTTRRKPTDRVQRIDVS